MKMKIKGCNCSFEIQLSKLRYLQISINFLNQKKKRVTFDRFELFLIVGFFSNNLRLGDESNFNPS